MTDTDRDVARARACAIAGGWDPAWIRTPADVRATLRGCVVDVRPAETVRDFLAAFCRHAKGRWAGQPFTLEPWQWAEVIRPLYGWRLPDGRRRFRWGYFSTGKKNGKTALFGVGLPLYHLVADREASPIVGLVAADRWGAGLAFDDIAATVRSSPALARVLEVIDSRKTIACPSLNGRLEAFSSDVPAKEGISLSYLNYDELHAIADRAMFDTLRYAGAARAEPLFIITTTAGVVDESSVCLEQYRYAKGVHDGSIDDDSYFVFLAEAPASADWRASSTWRLANPNLGITLEEAEVAQQCKTAETSPAHESAFRRYRCNQWQQQLQRWLPLSTWDACAGHPIEPAAYAGVRACGGLDLAAVSDLSAAAWLLPCPHNPDAVDLVIRCWLPEAALATGRAKHLYEQWRRDGWLLTTPGQTTDYAFIVKQLLEDAAHFGCDSIGIDRLFQGLSVGQALSAEGLEVFPVGMGFLSMAPLVQELERLVLAGQLHHGGHPILRWCVDAVEMRTDPAGNRKPSRENATVKIDALVAVLLGLDRWLRRTRAPAAPRAIRPKIWTPAGFVPACPAAGLAVNTDNERKSTHA